MSRTLLIFLLSVTPSAYGSSVAKATEEYGRMLKKFSQFTTSTKTRDELKRLGDSLSYVATTIKASQGNIARSGLFPGALRSMEQLAINVSNNPTSKELVIIQTSVGKITLEAPLLSKIWDFLASILGGEKISPQNNPKNPFDRGVDEKTLLLNDLKNLADNFLYPYNWLEQRQQIFIQMSEVADKLASILNDETNWADLCLACVNDKLPNLICMAGCFEGNGWTHEPVYEELKANRERAAELIWLLGYASYPYRYNNQFYAGLVLERRIPSPSLHSTITNCITFFQAVLSERKANKNFRKLMTGTQNNQQLLTRALDFAPTLIDIATEDVKRSIGIITEYTANRERDRFLNGDRTNTSTFFDKIFELAAAIFPTRSQMQDMRNAIIDDTPEGKEILSCLSDVASESIRAQLISMIPKPGTWQMRN